MALLLVVFLLIGCSKPKKAGDKKDKDDDAPPIKSVGIGAGDTLVYQSADPKSLPSFSVLWKSGGFDVAKGGIDSGNLVLPSGEIYSNGKKSSTYRSDTGDANKGTKRLNMRGNVVVQSLDKTQTLKSARGEYRGDVKIVRAIGAVTANTPFGTLSGAHELWATPDLRHIGTPDMLSQKLKIPALIALAATATAGSPTFQKGSDYKLENAGPIDVDRTVVPNKTTILPKKGGPLLLTIVSRGITFRSAGTVVIYTDPKTNEAQRIVTQGAAHVHQVGKTGTTDFDGVGSEYRIIPGGSKEKGQDATLQVGGRVTMTSVTTGKDKAGKVSAHTTISKGDRADAVIIATSPQGTPAPENPVRNAVLTGNVTIDVTGDNGIFHATGDKLTYDMVPKGAKLVLTGDLKLTGDLPAFIGDVQNANKLIVLLDKSNEWTNINLDNTRDEGTTTTADPKDKPKKQGGGP